MPATYTILRANAVNGEYVELGTVVTDKTGYDQYVDTNPGEGPNFYRVVQQ